MKNLLKYILISILALAFCDGVKDGSSSIEYDLVSDSFISLTLIACGTSLPELATSIAAAIKKNTSMALIPGLCSLVSPLTSIGIGLVDFMVMIASVLVLFAFSKDCWLP